MYDFSSSYVTNYGLTEGSNSWTTKCLSIADDSVQGTIALSCDCIMEEVPFACEPSNRSGQIIKGSKRFYTVHREEEWFMQINLSIQDTIFFDDKSDASRSMQSAVGTNQATYAIDDFKGYFLPMIICRSGDAETLDYNYSDPLCDWYNMRHMFQSSHLFLFAPGKGGKSVLNKVYREPTRNYTLDALRDKWDPGNATICKVPISMYSCAIRLPGKTIYFPLRYVNYGKDYIQPISGKISIRNGQTGTIVFAYNFASRELICEFSLHCHSFSSPNCANLVAYSTPIKVGPESISFYSFA